MQRNYSITAGELQADRGAVQPEAEVLWRRKAIAGL